MAVGNTTQCSDSKIFDIPDYVLCRSVRKRLIIGGHNITTV